MLVMSFLFVVSCTRDLDRNNISVPAILFNMAFSLHLAVEDLLCQSWDIFSTSCNTCSCCLSVSMEQDSSGSSFSAIFPALYQAMESFKFYVKMLGLLFIDNEYPLKILIYSFFFLILSILNKLMQFFWSAPINFDSMLFQRFFYKCGLSYLLF